MTKEKSEVKRMTWNIIVISFSFTLLYLAYLGTANLQSSLNAEFGTISLSTIYIASLISCLFVPTFMITKLSVKWTMALCMILFVAFIGAQFFPNEYTLIPSAALLGVAAGGLWGAQGTYLTHVGTLTAKFKNKKPVEEVTRLFGIFFMFFQCAQVFGNLIASTVLSSSAESGIDTSSIQHCGSHYCPWSAGNETVGQRPEQYKVNILFGVYLASVIAAAAIVALFVDPLSRFGEREGGASKFNAFQLVVATFLQLKDKRQLLLIPLTVYAGFEQAYITADFTLSFVTCAYGLENVGYVMMCFGVCDAIFCIVFGEAVKKIGRVPIFTIGAVLNLILIIVMFLWTPSPSQPEILYVIAGLWGVADAVWMTQLHSLYGIIFVSNEEASFSNYNLWEALGFTIAYGYSTLICMDAKLGILIAMLIIGMSGYYVVELIEHREKRKNSI